MADAGGAMPTREEVRRLVDALPEEALPAVQRYLAAVAAGCPPADPDDPVPLSPKEAAMMAASAEDMARGDYLTDAELDALLAREG